jgi:hypothetical protein
MAGRIFSGESPHENAIRHFVFVIVVHLLTCKRLSEHQQNVAGSR